MKSSNPLKLLGSDTSLYLISFLNKATKEERKRERALTVARRGCLNIGEAYVTDDSVRVFRLGCLGRISSFRIGKGNNGSPIKSPFCPSPAQERSLRSLNEIWWWELLAYIRCLANGSSRVHTAWNWFYRTRKLHRPGCWPIGSRGHYHKDWSVQQTYEAVLRGCREK
ncbi:hypothetical protein PIB30_095977 [Stylosanthes scabra]|uniref:Uncharacterized protein n=1 Tax=Stylosanthes scabra TaxID=79078 RepID=A0ABU6QWY9_9FABA|nr:hypothetical protein [Stylosanthes scabra]